MRRAITTLILSAYLTAPGQALADENGAMNTSAPYPCSSDKVASITEVCKAVSAVLPFVQCPELKTQCFKARQEVFTGLSGETANPANIKPWNGQGVSGPVFQAAGLCLMRDLNDAPMTAHAKADLPIGTIKADSVIDYMSFDKDKKVFTGSHRLTAVAPVIGKVDIMTQVFSARAVDSSFSPGSAFVGQYVVTGAHALDFEADAGNESFDFMLEGLKITTPYGTVEPKPYIELARGSFWSLSPYGGSSNLTMNPGAFQTTDVYGRLSGQKAASALNPVKLVSKPENAMLDYKFCGITLQDKPHCLSPSPVGWDSQLMLGARNMNPNEKSWIAPAGSSFPARPDSDPKTARGDAEKLPNGLAKAGVRIEYDVLGLLPDALLSNGFISVPEHILFADPNIFVAFASQFDFWNSQVSVWNPARAAPPHPLVSPVDVESQHALALYGGSSVGGRFAIDAGLDLRVKVEIELCCFLDDIEFDILNLHPRTAFLEEVSADTQLATRQAFVMTNAQAAVAAGKPFQSYSTLKGGQTDGLQHLTQCFAEPPPPAKTPPPATYEKGDPKDLIETLDMQCNVCIGYEDFTYMDGVEGQPNKFIAKTFKGFAEKVPYFSDAALAAPEKWTCGGAVPASNSFVPPPALPDPSAIKSKEQANAFNKLAQTKATNAIKNVGCYDQCRVDPSTGKFTTIVKSAKTLYAEGKITGAPNGCF